MKRLQSVLFNIKYWTPQTSMHEYLKRGFQFHNIMFDGENWCYPLTCDDKQMKKIILKKGKGIRYVVIVS